jgi:heme/copper-type cytochrome/quinol oxidase subunit 2
MDFFSVEIISDETQYYFNYTIRKSQYFRHVKRPVEENEVSYHIINHWFISVVMWLVSGTLAVFTSLVPI